MKQVVLFIMCIVFFKNVSSQSIEVGLSLYNFSNTKANVSRDSVLSSDTKNSGPYLATLGIDYINSKNRIFGLQYGYTGVTREAANTQYTGVNLISSIYKTNVSYKTHFVKLSFGKRYYIDKLGLSSYISLPVSHTYKNVFNLNYTEYNSSGTDIVTFNRTLPNETKIGFWLGQSFIYPVYKKLLLGVDVQYGVDYITTKGKYTSIENRAINGVSVSSADYFYNITQTRWSTVFTPAIVLKYIIAANFKDDHFRSVN